MTPGFIRHEPTLQYENLALRYAYFTVETVSTHNLNDVVFFEIRWPEEFEAVGINIWRHGGLVHLSSKHMTCSYLLPHVMSDKHTRTRTEQL